MEQNSKFDFEGDATVFGFTGETWFLRGVSGEWFGKSIPIDHTFTIGRAPDCDLTLNSKQVSRQHANISRLGTVLVLDDLQSANGTFVNNQRVSTQVELKNGDQIAFSRNERFQLTLRKDSDSDEFEDDDSYAQVVNKAAPATPAKAAVEDGGDDTLTWVVIAVTVVVVVGFAIWAFS